MQDLHDLLVRRRDVLLAGWMRASPKAPDDPVWREVGSLFLEALQAELRPSATPPPDAGAKPGAGEGAEAAHVDLASAIEAFGALHRSLLELASEADLAVTVSEQKAVAAQLSRAIAAVAERAARQHDRDLHHLAHQLRNPLGSALMALTLLRARMDLGESTRLAEMLERNLQRLQKLIDESVGEGAS